MDDEKMAVLTEDFPVKADKMRVLAKAGVSRGDIARFLGVRYQQVRNTLEGDKRTGNAPELDKKLHHKKVVVAKQEVPFRQIASPLSRTQEGTGLGLALVKSLIECHGGRLELDSVVNRGTTARLIIPASRCISKRNALSA